ncbi:MAG: 4'-phosphopantetheinyl transferase superfamily protein [Gammaproteobacteria bacterium]|nr:4'-phosphopantetheinyl transferase superfamily protein [Gammaproteobacteria bacterium]
MTVQTLQMSVIRDSLREATSALTQTDVHLWLADLGQTTERLIQLTATLSMNERERAARFRFPEHQERFIVGRGLLRELLGAYLDRPAATLCFNQGSHGKPTLAGEAAEAGLHFNLSHSGDRVLYAVAYREVGVDLEIMDRRLDHAAIAERICTPREWAAFQGLSAQGLSAKRIHEIFFACWTRKEAIAKALGEGLASGLSKLEVCDWDHERLHKRVGLNTAGREWSVLNLPLEATWAGALAAAGVDWHWRGWRWEGI